MNIALRLPVDQTNSNRFILRAVDRIYRVRKTKSGRFIAQYFTQSSYHADGGFDTQIARSNDLLELIEIARHHATKYIQDNFYREAFV